MGIQLNKFDEEHNVSQFEYVHQWQDTKLDKS